MHEFTIFRSQLGGQKMTSNGYIYTERKDKSSTSFTVWRCEDRKCTGKAKTENGEIIVLTSHNHDANIFKASNAITKSNIITRALETNESPSDILHRLHQNIYIDSKTAFPKLNSLIDRITKVRKKNKTVFFDNSHVAEIHKTDNNGRKFLFYESKKDEKKLYIFTTYINLIHIKNSEILCCDGTFYSCPSEFNQLYTIQANIRGKFHPLLFCFMETKEKKSYDILFDFMKKNLTQLKAKIVIFDFEHAAFSSFHAFFPETTISGCFFHLSQIIWRKIQADRNVKLYKEDALFQKHIKMILSMAYVPNKNIEQESENLLDFFLNTNAKEAVLNIFFWFESNYLKNKMFKIKKLNDEFYNFWNVSENILHNLPKTTNSIEGWHRSLNNRVSSKNPSFYEILQILKNEQQLIEIKICESLYSKTCEKSTDIDIKNCIECYESFYGVEFLMKIAYFINLKTD